MCDCARDCDGGDFVLRGFSAMVDIAGDVFFLAVATDRRAPSRANCAERPDDFATDFPVLSESGLVGMTGGHKREGQRRII